MKIGYRLDGGAEGGSLHLPPRPRRNRSKWTTPKAKTRALVIWNINFLNIIEHNRAREVVKLKIVSPRGIGVPSVQARPYNGFFIFISNTEFIREVSWAAAVRGWQGVQEERGISLEYYSQLSVVPLDSGVMSAIWLLYDLGLEFCKTGGIKVGDSGDILRMARISFEPRYRGILGLGTKNG